MRSGILAIVAAALIASGGAAPAKLTKQHRTYLVPTLLIGQAVFKIAKTHPEQLNPGSAQKPIETVPPMMSK